jgi:hypothetical protein
MSYLTAIAIVLTAAIAAGVASYAAERLVNVDDRRRHHEVGHPVFLQLGVMLAVLLAFVYGEVSSQYDTTAQAINGECGALHGAAMLAAALPNNEGAPVVRAINTYVATVVHAEWPSMAQRRLSPVATEDFRAIMGLAAGLPLASASDAPTKAELLGLLGEAHANRETRAFEINLALPAAMWAVLIVMSAVLVGFVVLAGLEGGGHVFFAVAFAGCTVMILVLVRMLDYPFEGALALGNEDFVKLLREVSALARPTGI